MLSSLFRQLFYKKKRVMPKPKSLMDRIRSVFFIELKSSNLRALPKSSFRGGKGLETAHTLSLNVAVTLWKRQFGHGYVRQKDFVDLKRFVGSEKNLRSVCFHANRVLHVKYDKEILDALEEPKRLSSGARQRAKDIAFVLNKGSQTQTGKMSPPRQPKDLQALLKFCIEATKAEDAPPSDDVLDHMDADKREWLRKALSEMSVDVIQELTKCIGILSDEKVLKDASADCEMQSYALECVEDWVGQIDMANNFHKLGGFVALKMCLESCHDDLASGAGHVIAELAQNNPYCQERFVQEDFLPLLLDLMSKKSSSVRVKMLYAVSCISREYGPGLAKLKELNGFDNVLVLLQSDSEKLVTKASFFLASLMSEDQETKKLLTQTGLAQLLLSILTQEQQSSHEQVARTLLILSQENEEAIREAKSTKLDLQKMLEDKIALLSGKEEHEEQESYCKQLLTIYSQSSSPPPVDR